MFSFVLVPQLVLVKYCPISEKNGNVWFRFFCDLNKDIFVTIWTPVYWYSQQYILDNFTWPKLKWHGLNLVLSIRIQKIPQTKNFRIQFVHMPSLLFFISLQCEQSLFTFYRYRCFREFRQIQHLNRDAKSNCSYNTRCGTHPCLNSNTCRDLIAK